MDTATTTTTGGDTLEFSNLPTEIKCMIIRAADIKTRRNCRLVSKNFKDMVDIKQTFQVILDDKSYDTFKDFNESTRINHLIVQDFQKELSHSSSRSGLKKSIRHLILGAGLGRFEGIQKLEDISPYAVGWKDSTTDSLYNFCLGLQTKDAKGKISDGIDGISENNVKRLLTFNKEIELLTIARKALWNVSPSTCSFLGKLEMNNLTVLDVYVGSISPCPRVADLPQGKPYIKLFGNYFPSLKSILYSSTPWKGDFRLILSVLQCVARHSKTLKTLRIFHSTVYSLTNFGESEKGVCPSWKFEELRKRLMEVQLENIYIDLMKCGPNFGIRWRQLERDLLENQKHLVDARYLANARISVGFNYKLAFPSVQNTLQRLEVTFNCLNQEPFDCRSLEHCINLSKLKLNIVQSSGYFFARNPPKMIANVDHLPRSIKSFSCTGLLEDYYAFWISQNLVNLQKLTFTCLKKLDYLSVYQHFLIYLQCPALETFCVNNHYCEKISSYVAITKGLTINSQRRFTSITRVNVNRRVFKVSKD